MVSTCWPRLDSVKNSLRQGLSIPGAFVGESFAIEANIGTPPVGWKLQTPHIVGGPPPPNGNCEFTFTGPVNIEVHYLWKSVGAGAITPNGPVPDNTGEAGAGGGSTNDGDGGKANGGDANSGDEGNTP